MKRPVLWISIFCLIIACDRYGDPEVKLLKDYSFSFQQTVPGNEFFAGDFVGDSIGFSAVNNKALIKDSLKVQFEVVKGGGQVSVTSGYTDKNGIIYTRWKLGTKSFEQTLRAKTYDLTGAYLNSSDLITYGFRTNEWDTLSNSQEADIMGMAADTVNKITLMIRNGYLFQQGDRYYVWNQVPGLNLTSLNTINIDRNKVFYISTSDGNMLKSVDHGATWETCTRPYPNVSYNLFVSISNDNYIWVYAYNNPTRYSKDQGKTWTDSAIGFTFNAYGDVFRLKDGSLLLDGENCCSLFRSIDNGLTWTEIATPGRPVKLYVNENDEIFIASMQGGIYLYKSIDYGATYTYLYATSYEWTPGNANVFNKLGHFYYVAIPGWGILKSADLTSYDIYWINSNLKNLFIDHNGVMIATYWNWQDNSKKVVYYRKNTE